MAEIRARSTEVAGTPASVAAAVAHARDEVLPAVQRMPGCLGLSVLADPRGGRCIVTTSWRDGQALADSREEVRPFAERTAALLGGEPEVREWEVAAMHRVLDAGDGARARVTWLRTPPDAVDRAVDAVRLSLMPKLDDLPGFCSVSVLVRRDEGLTVAAVSYGSREDAEAAADGAREFREGLAPAMGLEVLDTAEFDVAVAHLRVPETT
ncbi:putative quinol monooxygenase [Geodermatophilus nigrescens]|uniref:Antibiotic biosynthesis monooxygenase n=1 Tax=Geodermatophilus nigrescens TaxID=1070870 RepID=A0A1M5HLI2_9ACTN|nr:antibiotic biosynthesis monooxygenase [Geodermatophilus nigrescens]SHG16815.1 Antibiotic biosynthesis monooxygenase [Geodermatophilus nigrescens]